MCIYAKVRDVAIISDQVSGKDALVAFGFFVENEIVVIEKLGRNQSFFRRFGGHKLYAAENDKLDTSISQRRKDYVNYNGRLVPKKQNVDEYFNDLQETRNLVLNTLRKRKAAAAWPPSQEEIMLIEYRYVHGHVEVYQNGVFLFSADTKAEAEREIEYELSLKVAS